VNHTSDVSHVPIILDLIVAVFTVR
jgi:hypothetical protein